ncbi:hypothetical protein DL765_006065 [Monosporascus sp. GIB2]|nr:hypothetical protein DL765_006065 [Monosporascus sp. GIB2]
MPTGSLQRSEYNRRRPRREPSLPSSASPSPPGIANGPPTELVEGGVYILISAQDHEPGHGHGHGHGHGDGNAAIHSDSSSTRRAPLTSGPSTDPASRLAGYSPSSRGRGPGCRWRRRRPPPSPTTATTTTTTD